MINNSLRQSVWIVLGVLVIMLLIRYIPEYHIAGLKIKRVDILSDVIKTPKSVEISDTLQVDTLTHKIKDTINMLSLPKDKETAYVDSCPKGMTYIEDFADSTEIGMYAFYEALDRCDSIPVRIAYFGDSFIEGDILTSDLRELYQSKYGGCGVGFVNITSDVAGFRRSIIHRFNNWKSYSIMSPNNGYKSSNLGLSGEYFIPEQGASVQYGGVNKFIKHADKCEVAQIILNNPNPVEMQIELNKSENKDVIIPSSNSIHSMTITGDIHSIRYKINNADSALFYGVTFDGQKGVSLDNYSLRGSTGFNLASVSDATMQNFNKLRQYDLIILHYGLNVASSNRLHYDGYVTGMIKVIDKLKRNFPNASILVISVSDRDSKDDNGELVTMKGIHELVKYQRDLSIYERVAFWNLFEAMGGDGSMSTLVNHIPPYANKDYTHINFSGGKHLAEILFNVLEFGKSKFDRKKAYDSK